MTPQRQLITNHDPSKGIYGDCTRTAIAVLLDLPAESVPNFAEDWTDSETYNRKMNAWLREEGYARVTIPFQGTVQEVMDAMQHHNEGVYYLMGCSGTPGVDHTVVCCGDKLVCDPAGKYDIGVLKPCTDGYVWVETLTPRDLTKI